MNFLKFLNIGLFIANIGLRVRKIYIKIRGFKVKKFASFDKELGGDGGMVSGSLGVEGASVKALIEITYPVEKVIEPALKAVDSLVDKLEALIPGDQSSLAAKLKAEARQEILELIAEKTAEENLAPAAKSAATPKSE